MREQFLRQHGDVGCCDGARPSGLGLRVAECQEHSDDALGMLVEFFIAQAVEVDADQVDGFKHRAGLQGVAHLGPPSDGAHIGASAVPEQEPPGGGLRFAALPLCWSRCLGGFLGEA